MLKLRSQCAGIDYTVTTNHSVNANSELELNFFSLDQNVTEIYPDYSNAGSCNATRIQSH